MKQMIAILLCTWAMSFGGEARAGRVQLRNCLPKSFAKSIEVRTYNRSGSTVTSKHRKVRPGQRVKHKCGTRSCRVCVRYKRRNASKQKKCKEGIRGAWRFIQKSRWNPHILVKRKVGVFSKGSSCP